MSSIRIDFSRPIAVFALPSVALYPHTADWFIAFEPRYRQMVEDCLRARGDGPILEAAPIALATYATRHWQGPRLGEPALRPAVCIATMVEHRALPDGRHQILLHGVCRGEIQSVAEPEGRRLYRLARVAPVDPRSGPPRRLPELERSLGRQLDASVLRRMQRLDPVREWIARGTVPTEVIVEQLAYLLSRGDEQRYALLAEQSGRERARFVLSELGFLSTLLGHAAERTPVPQSRGVHLN
ncbi:MAG: LON peptidase substrate-binding domain-containing protein [Phycisphaerales bacterium]